MEKINRKAKGKNKLDLPDSFVVFDIETTGLDTSIDEIIELSAIKVVDNEVVDKFSSLIKPSQEIDPYIMELTGITNDILVNAPEIDEVLPNFMEFIQDNILIGHNVNFDINFVYDNLLKYEFIYLENNFIDTMRIARKLLPELSHHRLVDLAEYFNIDYKGNHRALKDSEITLEVYKELKKLALQKYESIALFKNSFKKYPNDVSAKDITTSNTEFNTDNLLYDKYVVITGTLEKMSRKEAMQLIVDLGGHCEDRVTNKTNYLILGNNDYTPLLKGKKSSKLIKAEKLKLEGKDIEIISENVFYDHVAKYINNNEDK